MSPEDLLNCSQAELEHFGESAPSQDLCKLFADIWQRLRPLYGGQPRSVGTTQGLSLAQAALILALQARDERLLIEARHMMGRTLAANEEFEKGIPFYEQVIDGLQKIGDLKQAARLRLALIGMLLHADRCEEAFEIARVAEAMFKENQDEMGLG